MYKLATIFLLIIVLVLIFHNEKFEGLTAEEWYDFYQAQKETNLNFKMCIEDFEDFDYQKKRYWGSALNYCNY